MTTRILVSLAMIPLVYMSFAFAALDLDFRSWSPLWRFMTVAFMWFMPVWIFACPMWSERQ